MFTASTSGPPQDVALSTSASAAAIVFGESGRFAQVADDVGHAGQTAHDRRQFGRIANDHGHLPTGIGQRLDEIMTDATRAAGDDHTPVHERAKSRASLPCSASASSMLIGVQPSSARTPDEVRGPVAASLRDPDRSGAR